MSIVKLYKRFCKYIEFGRPQSIESYITMKVTMKVQRTPLKYKPILVVCAFLLTLPVYSMQQELKKPKTTQRSLASLFSLSLKTIVAAIKEEKHDPIDFLEKAGATLPDELKLAIIDSYLDGHITELKPQSLIQLATYCIWKKLEDDIKIAGVQKLGDYLAKPRGALTRIVQKVLEAVVLADKEQDSGPAKVAAMTHLYLRVADHCIVRSVALKEEKDADYRLIPQEEKVVRLVKALQESSDFCRYAKQAQVILQELEDYPYFSDRSHLQPFSHACLIDCSLLLLQFYVSLHEDSVFQATEQALIHDEQRAFRLLKLPDFRKLCTKYAAHLIHWCDVFNKQLFIKALFKKPIWFGRRHYRCNRDLPLWLERFILLGDYKTLEDAFCADAKDLTQATIPYHDGSRNGISIGMRPISILDYALSYGYSGLARLLYAHGARLTPDAEGESPWPSIFYKADTNVRLHGCVDFNSLLSLCDPQDLSDDDLFAITERIKHNSQLFFDRYATSPSKIRVLFCGACYGVNRQLAELALSKLEESMKDTHERKDILTQALCCACGAMTDAEQRKPFITWLINKGALINGEVEGHARYATPLQSAAYADDTIEMVPFLLQLGAIDTPTKDGRTARNVMYEDNYTPIEDFEEMADEIKAVADLLDASRQKTHESTEPIS